MPQLAGHCATEAELKYSQWQDWYGTIERELDELRKTCDQVIVGGLSAGAVLSLHLAANRPDDVHGVACFAPTIWLNGWGVPWYARLFRLVHHKWFANHIHFTECEPFGIKDKRLREMVVEALHSGDPSQAGVFSTPGGPMLEFRWLVDIVKKQLPSIKQPALMVHPRDDDRADLGNAFYLQRNLAGPVEMTVLERLLSHRHDRPAARGRRRPHGRLRRPRRRQCCRCPADPWSRPRTRRASPASAPRLPERIAGGPSPTVTMGRGAESGADALERRCGAAWWCTGGAWLEPASR